MSYADQHKSWPMISILSAGFAALAFWASQSDLDQLVRATGQVIPDARTQIIQAADGGVLFELRVQEGQAVKAGQILAVLEKERAQAYRGAGGADEGGAWVSGMGRATS